MLRHRHPAARSFRRSVSTGGQSAMSYETDSDQDMAAARYTYVCNRGSPPPPSPHASMIDVPHPLRAIAMPCPVLPGPRRCRRLALLHPRHVTMEPPAAAAAEAADVSQTGSWGAWGACGAGGWGQAPRLGPPTPRRARPPPPRRVPVVTAVPPVPATAAPNARHRGRTHRTARRLRRAYVRGQVAGVEQHWQRKAACMVSLIAWREHARAEREQI